jgi:hypothetical protein
MKNLAPLHPGLPAVDLGARRAFHAGQTGHMSHMSHMGHMGGPGCAPARSANATRRRFTR